MTASSFFCAGCEPHVPGSAINALDEPGGRNPVNLPVSGRMGRSPDWSCQWASSGCHKLRLERVKSGHFPGYDLLNGSEWVYRWLMLRTGTIQITTEILALIAKIDEFKGAWRTLGILAPERLSALRRVATIESIGSSTRIVGSKLTDREVEQLLANCLRSSASWRKGLSGDTSKSSIR